MHGLAIVLAGLWLGAFWEPARLQGAADLLRWQGRRTEAIACLDQASLRCRPERRAIAAWALLHALGRQAEAGAPYALVFSLKDYS